MTRPWPISIKRTIRFIKIRTSGYRSIIRTQASSFARRSTPRPLIPAIKATVYQAGSDQPIYNVQTMRQIVADSMSEQRFPMILLGTFAGLALLLAAVGIYGMISYSVTQRVQEIGIRMALGADKGNVLRLFIGRELRLVLAGIAAGAAGALILTRTLSSLSHLLYGIRIERPADLCRRVACFDRSSCFGLLYPRAPGGQG